MHPRTAQTALTLTELLVALAILCVLLATSIPTFSSLQARAGMNYAVKQLVQSFHLARQISRLTGTAVTICPSSDGTRCDKTGDWHQGWLVLRESGTTKSTPLPPDSILHSVRIPNKALSLQANRPAFTLREFGQRSTNGSFRYCDARLPTMRTITISYTGKPRVGTTTASECAGDA